MFKMFKTKRDVDIHVSQILNKIRDEKEKNSRGYQFARLYYDVGDCETARKYLQAFLSVREAVPQAHKLMGKVYESLKEKLKAVQSYERSLILDDNQKDLVLKICEIFCEIPVDAERARYWAERAEKFYPDNYIIFKLKEKIVESDSQGDVAELEHLISLELVKKPTDVKLHVKLLQLYLRNHEVEKAYEHAQETEKRLAFPDSMEWYECLVEVYQVFQDQHGGNGNTQFHTQKLFALCSLSFLRLQAEDRDIISCVNSIHRLDVSLQEAVSTVKGGSEWDKFLQEVQGQFFFILGTLLLKRAQKGQISWKDAGSMAGVCYLLSNHFPAIVPDRYPARDGKKLFDRLCKLGHYRLSQGGHVLQSLSKLEGDMWARKLKQQLCTVQGRDGLFNIVYTLEEMRRAKQRSYLMQSDIYCNTLLSMLSDVDLRQCDRMAYLLYPDNLNQLMWIILQEERSESIQWAEYVAQIFPDLKFSVQDITGGDPGTLTQLDIQVFLIACAKWASQELKSKKKNLYPILEKPDILPACLSKPICSIQQQDCWTAVYKLQLETNCTLYGKVWGTVMRGLETVRLVPPNKLPLFILVHVAKTLDQQAMDIERLAGDSGLVTPELKAFWSRAAFCWQEAMDMVKRLEKNQTIKMPKESLFPDDSVLNAGELKVVKDQCCFAMATIAMRESNHEEALRGFESLYSPWASYNIAQIYKRMSLDCDANGNAAGSEVNEQNAVFLSKAKDALYQTVDRLRGDKSHELHERVNQELDDVTAKLIRVESGDSVVTSWMQESVLSGHSLNHGAEGGASDDEEPIKSTPITSPSRTAIHGGGLHASPTRIDMQLKSLENMVQSLSLKVVTLEEQVKMSDKTNEMLKEIITDMKDEQKFFRSQVLAMQQQGMPPMPPQAMSYPGTPQSRSMMMGHGYPPHQYDYPAQHPNIPQYGYGMSTPGRVPQPLDDDDLYHIDGGEYYEDEGQGQYGIPEARLIQEWPFGHQTKVEGKSTVAYAPQGQSQNRMPPPVSAANYLANAFRGPALQYGGYPQATSASPGMPAMPLPGYFSQPQARGPGPGFNQQQPQQVTPGSQSSILNALLSGSTTYPGAMSSAQPGTAVPSCGMFKGTPTTSTMPPNAVAGTSLTTKPRLIPESVGVPLPNKDSTKPGQQQKPSTGAAGFSLASAQPTIPTHVKTTPNSNVVQPSTPQNLASSLAMQGQSAALTLSALAAKHQSPEAQKTYQESVTTPSSGKTTAVPSTQPQTTPQKSVLGGFTFTSTPVVSQKTETDRPKATPTKQQTTPTTTAVAKPFAGFSFTSTTTSTSATSKPEQTTTPSTGFQGLFSQKSTPPSASGGLFGQAAAASSFSFGNVKPDPKAFQGGDSAAGFRGAGQQLFKQASPSKGDKSVDEDHIEEFEPEADFKPVVPLPDLVEVKTGEEEEESLFSERAKLFRFDNDTKQWKERGVGEMKLLKHKETGRIRILMRREQVFKLCANHYMTKEMKLTPMADKGWCWMAMDYAEEEMKMEKLAVKFKTSELALRFKEAFEEGQNSLQGSPAPTKAADQEQNASDGKAATKPPLSTLAALLTLDEGSWKCDGCLVTNKEEQKKCPCCGTLQPGVKPEDVREESVLGGGSFGIAPTGATDNKSAGFSFGDKQTFTFGTPTKPAADKSAELAPGGSKQTFTFGTPTKPATDKSAESAPGESKQTFTFGTPTKPATNKSAESAPENMQTFIFGPLAKGIETKFDKETKTGTTKSDMFLNPASKETEKKTTAPAGGTGNLFDKFKPASGSWKCDGCLVSNPADILKCPCCNTLKPGVKPEDVKDSHFTSTGSGFNIGEQQMTEKQTFSFGDVNKTQAFTFGSPQVSKTVDVGSDKAEGFKFVGSGFTFGTPQKTENKVETTMAESIPNPFSTPSKPSASSFAPTTEKDGGFKFTFNMTPTQGFGKAGCKSPLKSPGVASPGSPAVSEDGYYVTSEGDDTHIHFEPIIELPDKIEVVTGEEEEEVLFEHRAKLFRFIGGEWKERGLGDIKILFSPVNNKARVLMRREHVHKICCNHYITKELDLKPMPNTEGKALIWFAMDFADGDQKHEQFSVRFRSSDIANNFKNAFDGAKVRKSGEKEAVAISKSDEKLEEVKSYQVPEEAGAVGGQTSDDDPDVKFLYEEKPSEEEIELARKYQLPDSFYLRRDPCPGCRGCRDSDEENEDKEDRDDDDDDDDEEKYDSEEYEDEDDDDEDDDDDDDDDGVVEEALEAHLTLQKGYPTGDKHDKGSPMYRQEGIGEAVSEQSEPMGSVFGQGLGAGGVCSFATVAATASPEGFTKNEGKPFHFPGAGKTLFGQGGSGEGDDDDDEVEAGDDVHFEPIVALPELVEIVTGEEDEDILFSKRSKLFRFDKDANQWKEKGIGEMKILKNPITGRYRLLLRREQVHKIACNHRLSPDLDLKPMLTSETSWCWTANDFSENEPRIEQFCIKFKNIEQAREFKDAFDQCQADVKELTESQQESQTSVTEPTEEASEPETHQEQEAED